jgi:hypothetical protein
MRAGRKRKFNVSRHPSGQPKDEDPRTTVLAARQRLFGLSEVQSRSDLAGYALGRLALGGSLGPEWRPHLDAANGYVSATARYMRVKYPSWPLPKAMDFISAKGLGGEPEIDEVKSIERRYERYRLILARIDGISRMKFHSIAFDDVGSGPETILATLKCTQAIIQGLPANHK